MRKTILLAVALLVVAASAFAGSGEKCTQNTQACLNHWAKSRDKGWLGIKYDKAENGTVVVKEVAANGPGATAGFAVGDVMVAMNGIKMADKEALKKAKGEWKVGQVVTYTVQREGAEKEIAVTLAAMPEEVFASMVGSHMVENHVTTATAAAGTSEKEAKK